MSSPRVFIDASFWIAYRDGSEPVSSAAAAAVRQMFQARTSFVTTVPVFCEIHAYFSRSQRRRQVVLADFWRNPVVQIEPISPADQHQALELLEGQQDKSYSFCDALSYVVMQRLGLRRVATFDEHFRQFGGFEIIPEGPLSHV